jgi:preprotein translocase subunit YajC
MDQQMSTLLSLVILVGAFYFLLIRPQQQRQKQHRALMASLVEGDRVVTIGGVYGTIARLDDDRVGVEVASGFIVEFDRAAIARKIEPVATEE